MWRCASEHGSHMRRLPRCSRRPARRRVGGATDTKVRPRTTSGNRPSDAARFSLLLDRFTKMSIGYTRTRSLDLRGFRFSGTISSDRPDTLGVSVTIARATRTVREHCQVHWFQCRLVDERDHLARLRPCNRPSRPATWRESLWLSWHVPCGQTTRSQHAEPQRPEWSPGHTLPKMPNRRRQSGSPREQLCVPALWRVCVSLRH
jgi:hypothetical protein